MIYSLDANACIAHLRSATGRISKQLASHPTSEIAICSVVRGELLYGARRSRDVARNIAEVRSFLGQFRSLPFDDDAAEHYAEIRTLLAGAGTPIGPNDLLIAAVALANDVTLVTHNVREFSRVPGLKIEDWEAVP